MNPSTLDPMLRVSIGDAAAMEAAIRTLMGKEVAPRFEFVMERAPKVDEGCNRRALTAPSP